VQYLKKGSFIEIPENPKTRNCALLCTAVFRYKFFPKFPVSALRTVVKNLEGNFWADFLRKKRQNVIIF
tara:strand:- start:718 stop:924 length:207 start_codon:yes stop_codon:yes gene_type:complete